MSIDREIDRGERRMDPSNLELLQVSIVRFTGDRGMAVVAHSAGSPHSGEGR